MLIKKCFNKIINIFNDIKEDRIGEYAAQCAYYTILSFIPFIILLITMLQYTNITKQEIINIANTVTPNSMNELLSNVIEEVYSKSLGTISISLLVTLWSAGNGFFALYNGFMSIYKIRDDRNYIYSRLKASGYTIFFLIALILTLVLLVFGNEINYILKEHFPEIWSIIANILMIRNVVTGVILCIMFLVLYRYIPYRKAKIKEQIPGAIFSSLGWQMISFCFSIYLDVFRGFSIMYGSLTTTILIMMWVYACMYIILIGAEINKQISLKKCRKMSYNLVKK